MEKTTRPFPEVKPGDIVIKARDKMSVLNLKL